MWRYSLRRLAGAIPTLFVVITVAFFMMRLAPGGPFDRERMLTPEIEASIRKAYNLDEPLIVQYGIYLSKLFKGDLGPSFKYQDYTVIELIANGFPVSFRIGVTAAAPMTVRRVIQSPSLRLLAIRSCTVCCCFVVVS